MFCTACATLNSVAARRCVGCGVGLSQPGRLRPGATAAHRPRRRLVRLLAVVPLVTVLATGAVGADRYRDDRATMAAAYDRGAVAEAAGRLDEAIAFYGQAGGFRDADARRAAAITALAPYRTAYLDGVAALEAGRYDEAIALLVRVVRDLPGYEDATVRLAEARDRLSAELLAAVDEAEAQSNWLAAETALARLLAESPDDRDLQARLAGVRRDHAPILFTRDHQLYTIGPNLGDERLVTDEVPASWPVWSPDRSRIAFIAHEGAIGGNHRLFVVNADGSGLKPLAERVMSGSLWPVWSPDGTRLAFTSQAAFDESDGRALFSVHVVDVASGEDTDLTTGRLSFGVAPTWSPQGDRLALIGFEDRPRPNASRRGAFEVEVYVVHLASGELEDIGQGRFPDTVYLTWSPADDRVLVFGQRPQTYRSPAASSIHLLDLATDAVTNVHVGSQAVFLPTWSPDGSRFAYVEGDSVIRVRTRGRGEAWINVPSTLLGVLSWSPDGTTLLAPTLNPTQPSFLIPLGNGLGQEEPVLLLYDAIAPNAGPPAWSPARPASVAGPPSVDGTAYDRG